jgi:Pectate lyase superfamily protein
VQKQCVRNIDELRELNTKKVSCVELLGYYLPGDGGGGTFFWDGSFKPDQNLFPSGDDGGTIIRPKTIPSLQPGRWRRAFVGAVSVRWFGAKGNDDKPDTKAFLLAVKSSRIIFIPQGTYILSSLSLPSGVHLSGAGTSVTTLKHNDNASDHMLKPSGDFVIENLTIDGNKSKQPTEDGTSKGIVNTIFYDGAGGELFLAQNNLFRNSASRAIECINLSGEFRVVDNRFQDFGFEPFYSPDPNFVWVPLAIYLNYGDGGKILISRNSFVKAKSDPLGGGIMLSAQGGYYHSAIITDNYFEHLGTTNENHSGAIDLYNFIHRTVITGNRFYNLTYSAIKVGNSAELVIANNVIYKDSQESGKEAAAIFHSGCVRYDDCGGGPWNNIVISGNVIKDWKGSFGINVNGHMDDPIKKAQRHLISNNIIDNARGGINLFGVQDAVLEGNIIHRTVNDTPDLSGIVILVSNGTINIRGGEIISCYPYGIIGQPYVTESNTVIKNNADFIIQNVTFDANNSFNHIYLNGTSSVHISNNRFKGGIPPIFLNDIADAWLYGNVADNVNPNLGVANLRDSYNFWST